jgi:hypothetical protein
LGLLISRLVGSATDQENGFGRKFEGELVISREEDESTRRRIGKSFRERGCESL